MLTDLVWQGEKDRASHLRSGVGHSKNDLLIAKKKELIWPTH